MSTEAATLLSVGTRFAVTGVLLALAVQDLRHKRLPNALMRPAVIAGWILLLARLVLGQVMGTQVAVTALTAIVCLGLWWLHAFGGGDMKLVMALVALFPDHRLIYVLLAAGLLGSLLALVIWEGQVGLQRLSALFVTVSRGVWPGRSEVAAAYRRRGRPITFAFSMGAVVYVWLVWPGWV